MAFCSVFGVGKLWVLNISCYFAAIYFFVRLTGTTEGAGVFRRGWLCLLASPKNVLDGVKTMSREQHGRNGFS